MRNGTRSNQSLLTEDNDRDQLSRSIESELAAGFTEPADQDAAGQVGDLLHNKALFVAVSAACFTAAFAAASYAVWLGRKSAAEKALTSVHDLLKTCERRMSQIDSDLKRLPSVQRS